MCVCVCVCVCVHVCVCAYVCVCVCVCVGVCMFSVCMRGYHTVIAQCCLASGAVHCSDCWDGSPHLKQMGLCCQLDVDRANLLVCSPHW